MQGNERRRAPRLQVLDQIEGRLASLPIQVTLRDMGPLGFSVESALAFPQGASRLFLFTTAGGIQVVIEGAVAYSRPDEGDDSRHITGFKFVASRLTDTGADITVLLDAISGLAELEDITM